MKSQIKQWGNSAVVRIPKPLLKGAGLEVGSPVAISVIGGCLIVEPVKEGQYRLDALLAGVTPENLHSAVDSSKPVGKEII